MALRKGAKFYKYIYCKQEFPIIIESRRREQIIQDHINWLKTWNKMPSQIYKENYNEMKKAPIYQYYLNSNLRGCNRRKCRKWPTAEV